MKRVKRVREYMKEQEIDALLINSYENRRYLSGFTGSNGYLIVSNDDAYLITDMRYTEQAAQQSPQYTLLTQEPDVNLMIGELLVQRGYKKVAFESMQMTYHQFNAIRQYSKNIEWAPLQDDFLEFRAIKDEEEIDSIRKAVQIADQTILDVYKIIKPGISEIEIAMELEYRMKKYGSEGPTFGTIVAAGKRSSLPHATPTHQVVKENDMIVIDFGARHNGYMSDITRTIWVGEPEERMVELYRLVLKALEVAVGGVKPGVSCAELDQLARDVFLEAGLEKYSLRGLGHGVGLQIHEYPRVVIQQSTLLEEGMVFTIEPGLYVPDVGGVRIEDIVLVTETGCEVLTQCPRTLSV